MQHQCPFFYESGLWQLGIEACLEHDTSKDSSKTLTVRGFTSSNQVPWGYSPHVWVVMKGHFVNPSRESSSFCRRLRIIDLVPIGEVRNNSRSPRLLAFTVRTAWTCSRYRTSVFSSWHAFVVIFIIRDLEEGIFLKKC